MVSVPFETVVNVAMEPDFVALVLAGRDRGARLHAFVERLHGESSESHDTPELEERASSLGVTRQECCLSALWEDRLRSSSPARCKPGDPTRWR